MWYYHLLMLPPSAMAPGSISMTMKASGIGSAHWYSVFDGKLVNRGCLFLRLTVSGAAMCCKAAQTTRFLWHIMFCCLTALIRFFVAVVFHTCFVCEGQLAAVFSHKRAEVLLYIINSNWSTGYTNIWTNCGEYLTDNKLLPFRVNLILFFTS